MESSQLRILYVRVVQHFFRRAKNSFRAGLKRQETPTGTIFKKS